MFEPFCICRRPWQVAEAAGEIEVQGAATFHHGLKFQFPVHGGPFPDEGIKRVADRLKLSDYGTFFCSGAGDGAGGDQGGCSADHKYCRQYECIGPPHPVTIFSIWHHK